MGFSSAIKNMDISGRLKEIASSASSGVGAFAGRLFDKEGLRPEAMQGRANLDKIADLALAKICHGLGVAPTHFVRAIHKICAQVAQLDGYQPQPFMLVAAGDTATEIPYATLNSTAQFDFTIHNNQDGVGFRDGCIKLSAFKAGNTEDGEPITILVSGRRSQVEKYQMTAGETKVLPWPGVFDQSIHTISLRSGLGDATNPVQVYFEADTRALDLDSVKVARASLPQLEKAIIDIDEAEMQGVAGITGAALKAHPAMQKLVQLGQAAKLGQNKKAVEQKVGPRRA